MFGHAANLGSFRRPLFSFVWVLLFVLVSEFPKPKCFKVGCPFDSPRNGKEIKKRIVMKNSSRRLAVAINGVKESSTSEAWVNEARGGGGGGSSPDF